MIIGIGNDIVNIRRIESTLRRFGDNFTRRVFTDIECDLSNRRRLRVESYAKRFAAKEACAKALGTGVSHGISWRDMGVVNLPNGQPTLQLTGGAASILENMTPAGHKSHINLTITDDFPWAQAFVIISCIPIIS